MTMQDASKPINTPQDAVTAAKKWKDYLSPSTNIDIPGIGDYAGGQVQISGDTMSKLNNFLKGGSSSSGLSSSGGSFNTLS